MTISRRLGPVVTEILAGNQNTKLLVLSQEADIKYQIAKIAQLTHLLDASEELLLNFLHNTAYTFLPLTGRC